MLSKRAKKKAAPKERPSVVKKEIVPVAVSQKDWGPRELIEEHEARCSKQPPECRRTYDWLSFKAHVLELVNRTRTA